MSMPFSAGKDDDRQAPRLRRSRSPRAIPVIVEKKVERRALALDDDADDIHSDGRVHVEKIAPEIFECARRKPGSRFAKRRSTQPAVPRRPRSTRLIPPRRASVSRRRSARRDPRRGGAWRVRRNAGAPPPQPGRQPLQRHLRSGGRQPLPHTSAANSPTWCGRAAAQPLQQSAARPSSALRPTLRPFVPGQHVEVARAAGRCRQSA